jgi:hypothetical protein
LDENFDCPEVKDLLRKFGVRFRLYSQDVTAGTDDERILPRVGKKGWLLITSDKNQRTRPLEVHAMRKHGVRHFCLPPIGAIPMAELLVKAKNDIKACVRDHSGYVSANVIRSGAVNVIRDERGSLHQRGEQLIYFQGKKKLSVPSER